MFSPGYVPGLLSSQVCVEDFQSPYSSVLDSRVLKMLIMKVSASLIVALVNGQNFGFPYSAISSDINSRLVCSVPYGVTFCDVYCMTQVLKISLQFGS